MPYLIPVAGAFQNYGDDRTVTGTSGWEGMDSLDELYKIGLKAT